MTIRDALREAIDYMPANTVSERARRHRWEATLDAERARPVPPDGLDEAINELSTAIGRLRLLRLDTADARPVPPDGLRERLRPLFAEYEEADMVNRIRKGDRAANLTRYILAEQAIDAALADLDAKLEETT